MKLPAFLRTFSTLQLALGISVAVHAALISVRFIDPEGFNRVFQDTPLEVILVNAKSNERPDKAQAIAQANLAGGGDAEKGRATSPLPYTALTTVGDDYEEAQRKMDAMQEQQAQLLAQLRKQLATMPEPDPRQASQSAEQANEAVGGMLNKSVDVHDAMIALQRAEMSLQLTVQIRNKLVQAYQDIMRMPV